MDDELLLLRVSAALDGEEAGALPDPLPAGAARFDADIRRLRAAVRVQEALQPPNLVPAVLGALPERRSARARHRFAVAAAGIFVAGMVGGGVLGGVLDRGAPSALASLADDLLDAQATVERYEADLTIIEYGWDPAVPQRTYDGHLSFEAPARLALVIRDTTNYPAGDWLANDVAVVVDDTSAVTSGRPGCPVQLRPACFVEQPLVRRVTDRAPFSSAGARVEGAPLGVALPLDLVVPVGAFVSPGVSADESIVVSRRGGEVTVTSTVGRLESVVGALLAVGDWRDLHPADLATLELDPTALTLRGLEVRAGSGVDRDRWATRSGYDDAPGDLLVSVELTPAPAQPAPVLASPTSERSEGFDPELGGAPAPEPAWLPTGFETYLDGQIRGNPSVGVRSYTDGRAWLMVRAVVGWEPDRLFGEIDALAQPIDVPDAGRLYLDPSGTRVGLHGAGLEVEVAGSIGPAALLRVAGSLGVSGLAVPDHWAQAASDDELPAGALSSDRASAVRADDGVVTVLVPGPGHSGFSLVQHPGSQLDPPSSPDAVAVEVRGTVGRWDPLGDSLEWVEEGWVVSLRSEGLGLAEMVAAAGALEVRT